MNVLNRLPSRCLGSVILTGVSIFFTLITVVSTGSDDKLSFSLLQTFISNFQIFRVVTAPFYNSFLRSLILVPILYHSSCFIEPSWGVKGLFTFLSFSYFPGCLATLLFSLLLFFISGANFNALRAPLHGSIALLSALFVACAYIRPEVSPTFKNPFGSPIKFAWFRLQYFPFCVLLFSLFKAFSGSLQGVVIGFWYFSITLSAFCYIRYIKPTNGYLGSTNGDRGPQFAFSLFFPTVLRPPIRYLSKLCSKTFKLPPTQPDNTAEDVGTRLGISLPLESNRERRQRAQILVEEAYAMRKAHEKLGV
ncbi:hypothetical protein RCL1_000590 [Eukaryota sp. TZLM3-RCL]